jgi:S-formylglutathione hydrolase FrmB
MTTEKLTQDEKVTILRRVGEPKGFEVDWTRNQAEYQCVIKTIEWYKKRIEELIEDLKEENTPKSCNPECELCNPPN